MNLLRFMLCLALSNAALAQAFICADIFRAPLTLKKSYTANELSEVTLKQLIGTRISYQAKYLFTDPSDSRTIRGEGTVVSVALWSRDKDPTFSIRYMNARGESKSVQIFSRDHTFKLTVKGANGLSAFMEGARQADMQVHLPSYPVFAQTEAEFYRAHQTVRIAYISLVNGKPKIQEVESQSIQVPSDFELAMAHSTHSEAIEVQTTSGPVRILLNEILATAYKVRTDF